MSRVRARQRFDARVRDHHGRVEESFRVRARRRHAEVTTARGRSLRRMDMAVKSDEPTAEGRRLTAAAADRTIDIELEKLTSRTTRMRVTAKQGWFWRDRATAGEIIAQTEHALEDSPALTQKPR